MITSTPIPEALFKLKHVFNLLGLRVIPAYFLEANKPQFEKWQYNACNQTALITGCFLQLLLDTPGRYDTNPFRATRFNVTLHEGQFEDPHFGNYNHAWCFASSPDYGIFIDVARISNPTIFQWGTTVTNDPQLYGNYKLLSVKQLDFGAMLTSQPEYYTGKTGLQICAEINQILMKHGYNLTKFDWGL